MTRTRLLWHALVGVAAALPLSQAAAQSSAPQPSAPQSSAPQSKPIRVLLYGDSNTWGWTPTQKGFPTTRLPESERLAGVIRAKLGPRAVIIEDGLNNRTTDLDDPHTGSKVPGHGFNGAANLPAVLAAHAPLDVVVLMLGTNDLKAQFSRDGAAAARGADKLVEIVQNSAGNVATTYAAPAVLLVAPPPVGRMQHELIAGFFKGAETKSKSFAVTYGAVAKARGVAFLDAGAVIGPADGYDGVHITAAEHRSLGEALAARVDEVAR